MNKYFKWGLLLLYVIITFVRVINHQTWYDEARAWLIAENLNLFEIFDLMKIEGHTFVWFVLLMPFAKTHFAYPYSMQIMNWIFCVSAVFVMWKYSPFNNWVKALIIFSVPFFLWYPVLARCYSIGILLLFILMVMFKDKLKHPIVYSILIFFTANTSVMAMVGAFSFACIFLYELFKNKQYKDLSICSGVGILCSVILYLQLFGADASITGRPEYLDGLRLSFFLNVFIFPHIVNAILLVIFIIAILFSISKSKTASFFLVSTYALLFIIFHFVYSGNEWHHYFFYVYFIIACWIFMLENQEQTIYKKNLIIILALISMFYCFDYRYRIGAFHSGSKYLAEKVEKLNKNSSIIFVGKNFFQLIPYIEDKNIDYYYAHTSKKIDNPIKEEPKIIKALSPEVISEIYGRKENTYLFVLSKDTKLKDFSVSYNNEIYNLVLEEIFGNNVYIFKVNTK